MPTNKNKLRTSRAWDFGDSVTAIIWNTEYIPSFVFCLKCFDVLIKKGSTVDQVRYRILQLALDISRRYNIILIFKSIYTVLMRWRVHLCKNKNKIRTSEAEILKKISTLSLNRNLLFLINERVNLYWRISYKFGAYMKNNWDTFLTTWYYRWLAAMIDLWQSFSKIG